MRTGTIVGSYQLIRKTGETSWSEVFATRKVGAKRLYEAHALHTSPEPVRRALAEVLRADAAQDASHLARPAKLLTHAGRIVLVARDDWSESLEALHAARVRWPLLLAVSVIGRVARALDVAGGRPHGDLCPANICVRYDTRTVEVRYAGVARAIAQARPSRSHPVGTIAFMAPERIDDPLHAGARADVYSLGLVLYEMLTQRRAITGDSTAALIEAARTSNILRPRAAGLDLSHAKLEDVLLSALRREPGARYDGFRRLAYALEGYVASRRPAWDFATEMAKFVDTQLAERAAARAQEIERLLRMSVQVTRTSSMPRARRNSVPLEAPVARPFVDPALAVPTAGLDGPTDDLTTEPTPLPPPPPRLDPALAFLLRVLLLGTLLVASISVALLYVATEGVDTTLAAWRAVWTVFQ